MSEESAVLHFSTDGIATVTLNRPDVHNAFDEELIERLGDMFEDLAHQEGVRAVVVAAAGKSYCAGADLNWMKRAAHFTEEDNREDALLMGRMLKNLHAIPKPTIALVQGAAYGGGLGLVAACDIAIGVQEAKFCLSEVKLGLIPAVISPYVVEAIGVRACRRYFLTAEIFDAEEAYGLGLLHEVVPNVHDLAEARDRILERVMANAPEAMADSKDLIYTVAGRPIDQDVVSETADRIATRRASDEAKEGITAFFEKRKANWIQS
ncbi:enoyl-CoA hydratase-related protein [Sneathiella chinensis]|uniref:Methylglutaconyl-CoA hydratase n=1 Tax=Sneathiella chinensis TaxID=349750 RepID=A0ABQ5U6E1_9PROT|nr:enoyl-CoA hydratase-related protein [Sneathiella chinensis]GLQ07727.1 methylglutaconyl-CoA hydratase [Sneathiella chinensis]